MMTKVFMSFAAMRLLIIKMQDIKSRNLTRVQLLFGKNKG